MDDGLNTSKRPTISLLTILALFIGLGLGVVGSTLRFQSLYPDVQQPKNLTTCATNLAVIGLAVEQYHLAHSKLPQSQYELVPDYLPKLPTCPAAGRVSYRTSFGPELAPPESQVRDDYYIVECCGHNHAEARVAPNFPAYDRVRGLVVQTQW